MIQQTSQRDVSMQGRRLLLPDTSALSRSGPSCFPLVYFRGGRKAFGSLEGSKGWGKPLSASSVL